MNTKYVDRYIENTLAAGHPVPLWLANASRERRAKLNDRLRKVMQQKPKQTRLWVPLNLSPEQTEQLFDILALLQLLEATTGGFSGDFNNKYILKQYLDRIFGISTEVLETCLADISEEMVDGFHSHNSWLYKIIKAVRSEKPDDQQMMLAIIESYKAGDLKVVDDDPAPTDQAQDEDNRI